MPRTCELTRKKRSAAANSLANESEARSVAQDSRFLRRAEADPGIILPWWRGIWIRV